MNGDKSGESGTFLFSPLVPDSCDGRRSFPTNENSNLDGRGSRLPSAMDFAHFQSPKSLGSSPPITNKHFPFPAKFVNRENLGQTSCEYPIYRQNLGWSATSKIPDRLGFSRHMKTRLKPVHGRKKKIKMLLAGLGSVRIGKNCDLGLENAALGLRPRARAAFSRPRSQFFPIRTSQPANNICVFCLMILYYACVSTYLLNVTGNMLLKYRNINKDVFSLFISSKGRIPSFFKRGTV